MFDFLKKKTESEETLKALADGEMIPLSEVKDEMFSQKMMGDGVAIWQEGSEVCAPVDGELTLIAETKHAFGITAPNGVQLLVPEFAVFARVTITIESNFRTVFRL